MKPILTCLVALGLVCYLTTSAVFAQTDKTLETTDLSEMDWSDDPADGEDLSRESWADDPADQGQAAGDLSEMSWEDEEGENTDQDTVSLQAGMSEEEEKALDAKERLIHILGFLLFVGYIGGALMTAYFTRNRKLAVDYPPELLILLHTLWPLEWVFLLFAGKKVR